MVVMAFWTCVFVVLYVYVLYPVLVVIVGKCVRRNVKKRPYHPRVSIVISAYNEDQWIGACIENKLDLEYPKEKLEIVIVSDGSTDTTDEIVKRYTDHNVRLIHQDQRQGKTAGLNRAVTESQGEILVFCDANSMFERNALRRLTSNLVDQSVGYVTGRMVYRSIRGQAVGDGCSMYMRYENFLRRAEGRLGSVVGVNGGIDAIRRSLYRQMEPEQQPDFVLPLRVVEQGYRVVYEPEAILEEDPLVRSEDEYRMRVRVALRALYVIKDMAHLMNPLRHGLFAWQLISHKVLRYSTFIPLTILYISGLFLLNEGLVYQVAVGLQSLVYVGALSGWYLERKQRDLGFLFAPFYFCLVNVACGSALLKMILGKKQVTWAPRLG